MHFVNVIEDNLVGKKPQNRLYFSYEDFIYRFSKKFKTCEVFINFIVSDMSSRIKKIFQLLENTSSTKENKENEQNSSNTLCSTSGQSVSHFDLNISMLNKELNPSEIISEVAATEDILILPFEDGMSSIEDLSFLDIINPQTITTIEQEHEKQTNIT